MKGLFCPKRRLRFVKISSSKLFYTIKSGFHSHSRFNRIKAMNKVIVNEIRNNLEGEGNYLAKLLNSLSLLHEELGEHAWVGLYIFDEKANTLNLGPFQGTSACVSIKPGKGVVGTCYAAKRPLYVDDVKRFPGYISCDSKCRSEACFPLVYGDSVIAVFDIDSPEIDGLKDDLPLLEQIASLFANFTSNN